MLTQVTGERSHNKSVSLETLIFIMQLIAAWNLKLEAANS